MKNMLCYIPNILMGQLNPPVVTFALVDLLHLLVFSNVIKYNIVIHSLSLFVCVKCV